MKTARLVRASLLMTRCKRAPSSARSDAVSGEDGLTHHSS
jgi:hypothetical protein